MNIFDELNREKLPETLTQMIRITKRLGRLRRVYYNEHMHGVGVLYRQIRENWHYWEAV